MKIKKDDNVLAIAGKDRGRKGKVLRVLDGGQRVIVEGLNLVKKHTRPKRAGEKGQIVTISASIAISNLKLICPKCSKATRVGRLVKEKGQKERIRICKKCKAQI